MQYLLLKFPTLKYVIKSRTADNALLSSLCVFLIIWLIFLSQQAELQQLLSEFSGFLFLGVVGAIAANSTGAGGGIVFVPSFQALGMEVPQVIATSFAIQCFGMSVGSASWLSFFHSKKSTNTEKTGLLYQVLIYSMPFSILGLWLVQYTNIALNLSIPLIFSVFSLIFGFVVLYHRFCFGVKSTHRDATKLSTAEIVLITAVSFVGGIITAWISVGIGEILAVVLMLRGFSVMFAIACGVIVSAVTVIAGLPYYIDLQLINTDILLFAAPGAMVGGFIARYIAQALGAKKLKLLFALWILSVGFVGII